MRGGLGGVGRLGGRRFERLGWKETGVSVCVVSTRATPSPKAHYNQNLEHHRQTQQHHKHPQHPPIAAQTASPGRPTRQLRVLASAQSLIEAGRAVLPTAVSSDAGVARWKTPSRTIPKQLIKATPPSTSPPRPSSFQPRVAQTPRTPRPSRGPPRVPSRPRAHHPAVSTATAPHPPSPPSPRQLREPAGSASGSSNRASRPSSSPSLHWPGPRVLEHRLPLARRRRAAHPVSL